ncbi:hypothetical protein IV417_00930 [Alphaproteobacteria bacterium KMM 3653]|uniref:Uncharacterized protein n=1 Tax=Harenicola maris TaxID=2841044 RepID=A0AAP2CLW0_9RHOB|nr:hypothetical protein [Harenicola maris]
MTAEDIAALFTQSDGTYRFARWGRSIAPVVFGVEDETITLVKGAVEAICRLAGHEMAETDPELGVNFMLFFLREWDDLIGVPDLDRLIPELEPLLARLKEADANQYRIFRFDETGAIKAAFVFLRMDAAMLDVPADTLCLTQVAQTILLWSDKAFAERSPLAMSGGTTVLRPEIGAVIRAAYDPVMPVQAGDDSHALRLFARISAAQ